MSTKPVGLSPALRECWRPDICAAVLVTVGSMSSKSSLLHVSGILLRTPKLHGLSFQLFPQNVNHFTALSLPLSVILYSVTQHDPD